MNVELAHLAHTELTERLESFHQENDLIFRTVRRRDGAVGTTSVPLPDTVPGSSLAELYDQSWLRLTHWPEFFNNRGTVKTSIVDLFAGCGGMSLGVVEAIRAIGGVPNVVFANEIEREYLSVYENNLRPKGSTVKSTDEIFSGELGSTPSDEEARFQQNTGPVDILLAGPPCQGHSNLNNYTRRNDPKNELYLNAVRAIEVLQPNCAIIENVPGVRHDKGNVLNIAQDKLKSIGYNTITTNINCMDYGVAQSRTRTFLLASFGAFMTEESLETHLEKLTVPRRTVSWAIADLLRSRGDSVMDRTSALSPVSSNRVDWLFENGAYDLPDELRPDCHKHKQHSYKSVYGRMHWDRPAQTITTGFQVMGQGRYIHPKERRVITSREAARLQFIPDFYQFGEQSRKSLAKMIGNAVPPKMAYILGLFLLR